jgi:hypothetical protein
MSISDQQISLRLLSLALSSVTFALSGLVLEETVSLCVPFSLFYFIQFKYLNLRLLVCQFTLFNY